MRISHGVRGALIFDHVHGCVAEYPTNEISKSHGAWEVEAMGSDWQ